MDVDEAVDENLKTIQDNIAQNLPKEPLLGSFTTNALDKDEKGLQIRSSARVFKKMKLDQELDKKLDETCLDPGGLLSPNLEQSLLGTTCLEKHSDSEVKGQPIRTSSRVVKKAKQDVTSTITQDTKSKKDETKTDITKKVVRNWTYEEKLMFFEAINEFGKDFENIQQYINGKLKKKGATDDQLRAKDTVRTFYNRTFHEVSKHVRFADGVRKMVQELYGIINYGELHKKLGVITEKAFMKLAELIYKGSTCVRVKGKNIRIRTPMCRALIKLNQLDEKYEKIKLPHRVTVEIRPRDMTSFIHIQCLAQNPRLRTTLPLQKRLAALMQCLDKRWKSADMVNYEKSIVSNNQITNDLVPSQQEASQKLDFLSSTLRLSPPQEAKIELPSINVSEYLTRQTICLTAYEGRLGLDTFRDIKMMTKKKNEDKKEKAKITEPKIDTEPKMDIESKVEVACEIIKVESVKLEEVDTSSCNEGEPDTVLADAVHDAVNTILSLQTFERQSSEISETEDKNVKMEQFEKVLCKEPEPEIINTETLERIKRIRQGWTAKDSESLTIGEIYLMYGCDSKLILEYSWEPDTKEDTEKPKKTAANFLERWNETFEESWEHKQQNLTSSLSKLLSLAKLHYRKNSIKCPCGHECNAKTMKTSPNIVNQRIRRTAVVEDNHNVNDTRQDENILITVLPNGSTTQTKVLNNFPKTPLHILPKGPAVHSPTMQQQLNSIQRLKPKFTNRKGRRPRSKPIVVERKLPLLPNNLSGHQIVRMSIISQEAPAMPVGAQPIIVNTTKEDIDLQKVITDPEEENSALSTVPSSPSRILKENDSEWINSEVADYSLSSLLGHLESPTKNPSTSLGPLTSNMGSDLSCEVDAQLQSLLTESSMDFAANFADLAASVASDKKY